MIHTRQPVQIAVWFQAEAVRLADQKDGIEEALGFNVVEGDIEQGVCTRHHADGVVHRNQVG